MSGRERAAEDIECDTGFETCPACGQPRCRRCGGCKAKYAAGSPGNWEFECRSWTCRAAKFLARLVGRPYTKDDTPDTNR